MRRARFLVIKRRLWAGLTVPCQKSDASSGTGLPRLLEADHSRPEVSRPEALRRHGCFWILKVWKLLEMPRFFTKKNPLFKNILFIYF